MRIFLIIIPISLIVSCQESSSSYEVSAGVEPNTTTTAVPDTPTNAEKLNTTAVQKIEAHFNESTSASKINTGNTSPQELLDFARTLIGTPYQYGSTDPKVGFDCSGFITYVFNHFNIAVPRSSIDFTNVQTEIPLQQAKPGDLILFTGTDSTNREVGHMGIIIAKENDVYQFIHSTSGKQHSVTITPLNDYYMGRFMKVIRVFKQNNDG